VNGVTFTYNGNGQSSQDGALVSNDEELAAALAGNYSVITLAAGEYGKVVAKSNVTLNGMPGAKVAAVNLNGAENLTLKGLTFDAAKAVSAVDGKGNSKQWALVYSGDANKNNGKGARNLVIDGCTFGGTFAKGGVAIAFTDQNRTSGQSGNITIKNCTFEAQGSYYEIYCYYSGYGELNIENNVFAAVHAAGLPIYLGRYQSSTPVVVKNNVFEYATSQENAMFIQDHSNYGASFDAENNTYAK
jgi:Tfp pilus assembly protein FimT